MSAPPRFFCHWERNQAVLNSHFWWKAGEVEKSLQSRLTQIQCDNSEKSKISFFPYVFHYVVEFGMGKLSSYEMPRKKNDESVWLNIHMWAEMWGKRKYLLTLKKIQLRTEWLTANSCDVLYISNCSRHASFFPKCSITASSSMLFLLKVYFTLFMF